MYCILGCNIFNNWMIPNWKLQFSKRVRKASRGPQNTARPSGTYSPLPEFIDPVFVKTSVKTSVLGLFSAKTGSINSGTAERLAVPEKINSPPYSLNSSSSSYSSQTFFAYISTVHCQSITRSGRFNLARQYFICITLQEKVNRCMLSMRIKK